MAFTLRVATLLFFFVVLGMGALIPPYFMESVVAIGRIDQSPGRVGGWITEGSGFLYGWLVDEVSDPKERRYEIYLVTNRHVIAQKPIVFVRMNPTKTSEQGRVFNVPAQHWFTHTNPAVDVAAARLSWDVLVGQNIRAAFMMSDMSAAEVKKMTEIGVSAGDGVFVLGFPMNLAGGQRNYVIARPGSIARVGDLLESASEYFLIDSHVFPGNSGGPVILEPNDFHIHGTKSNTTAYLIGMVKDFIAYREVAVSSQTQRPRVIFEENSGLSEVIPIDRVNEAIRAWRSSHPVSPQPPLKAAPETK